MFRHIRLLALPALLASAAFAGCGAGDGSRAATAATPAAKAYTPEALVACFEKGGLDATEVTGGDRAGITKTLTAEGVKVRQVTVRKPDSIVAEAFVLVFPDEASAGQHADSAEYLSNAEPDMNANVIVGYDDEQSRTASGPKIAPCVGA